MEASKESVNNKPNNYCVNCKHCLVCQGGGRYICRNELIVYSYINNVKGAKFYDDKLRPHRNLRFKVISLALNNSCIFTKFVSLFKHK